MKCQAFTIAMSDVDEFAIRKHNTKKEETFILKEKLLLYERCEPGNCFVLPISGFWINKSADFSPETGQNPALLT